MNDPDAGRWLLSTACPVRRRVWNLQSPVRGRVLAHCWALRNQAPPLTFGSVGLNLQCLLGPDTFGWRAVVGVLFVNWIVDASIFRCLFTRRYRIFDAIRPPGFQILGGGLWCRVFVVFVECL